MRHYCHDANTASIHIFLGMSFCTLPLQRTHGAGTFSWIGRCSNLNAWTLRTFYRMYFTPLRTVYANGLPFVDLVIWLCHWPHQFHLPPLNQCCAVCGGWTNVDTIMALRKPVLIHVLICEYVQIHACPCAYPMTTATVTFMLYALADVSAFTWY